MDILKTGLDTYCFELKGNFTDSTVKNTGEMGGRMGDINYLAHWTNPELRAVFCKVL